MCLKNLSKFYQNVKQRKKVNQKNEILKGLTDNLIKINKRCPFIKQEMF